MNDMPFCTQLALQLEQINDALEPVLSSNQRDEVEDAVARVDQVLASVDHSIGATAILRVASALLCRIVSPSRIAS